MADAVWGSLPFDEAIDYFRNKVNFPADDYKSISGGMHARAFTVAGATNDALLSDFRSAIDKAISEGTSLGEFKKDFDQIVAKHGWSYNGSRGFRTDVIFNTNVNMAYAAGRWQQIERTAKMFPYLIYVTRNNSRVRPAHRAWHGIILPVDHPWWKTHFPPNGYRCYCHVRQLTRRQAEEMKASGKYITEAPADEWVEHVSSKTGEVTMIRKGIDFGFDYNPGIAAWGTKFSELADSAAPDKYIPLTTNTFKDYHRPDLVPLSETDIKPIPALKSASDAVQWLTDNIGADKVFSVQQGDFKHSLLLDAEYFGKHLEKDLNRSRFFPFIQDILSDPFEVWASFEKSVNNEKVVLRYRYIKAYKLEKNKAVLVVFDALKGVVTGHTYFQTNDMKYLNKQRYGTLLYGK